MGSKTCNDSFWMREEDKAFENALSIYSDDSNPWEKIAAAVPGRTTEEIKIHYAVLVADVNAIESGLVPLPPYADSFKMSRTLVGHAAVDRKGKRSEISRGESSHGGISLQSDRGCKRARPWSEEEHSSEDTSTGIALLESLLDSLADTPTPQGPSSQQISESAGASWSTPVNASKRIQTYEEIIIEDTITPADLKVFNSLFIFEHGMSSTEGPIIGEASGTAGNPQMLDFEGSSVPVAPDSGVHAPPTAASQPTLEPLPLDDGIELFPWSSRFDMETPDFAAIFYNEPDDIAAPADPVPE